MIYFPTESEYPLSIPKQLKEVPGAALHQKVARILALKYTGRLNIEYSCEAVTGLSRVCRADKTSAVPAQRSTSQRKHLVGPRTGHLRAEGEQE